MAQRIVTLPGDGIGPEIIGRGRGAARRLGDFELEEHLIGGASIDAHGEALTDEVLEACRAADAVLLAAVGGPKWDTTDPGAPRPEQGLLGLRKGLGLFANLRPVRPSPALLDASPLKPERIEGTDLLVVRELTGGIYFGESGREGDRAHDDCAYTVEEIERIARVGVPAAARTKVTSVDKANVLETSRLWRETVTRVHDEEFPDVPLDHLLVDNAAMQLVAAPAAVRRDPDREPLRRHPERRGGHAHRLAGDAAKRLAGRRPARASSSPSTAPRPTSPAPAWPTRSRCSARSRSCCGTDCYGTEAARVESAIDRALEQGIRTPDLGGDSTTEDVTRAVLASL